VSLREDVLEIFEEAQTLSRKREWLSGYRFIRRSTKNEERRLIDVALRSRRPVPFHPVPLEVSSERCCCGGIWEKRLGSAQLIHVGARTKRCPTYLQVSRARAV
jgi:hypothetical protein